VKEQISKATATHIRNLINRLVSAHFGMGLYENGTDDYNAALARSVSTNKDITECLDELTRGK